MKTEIEEYNKFMEEYKDAMIDDDPNGENRDPFYKYGPLTNQYWEHNPRILVCNSEPYGDETGVINFSIDIFANWMKLKVRTAENTAKFICSLINAIDKEKSENIELKNFEFEHKKNAMEKVAYLNFRIDQNSGKSTKLEVGEIRDQFFNTTNGYIKEQIEKLNPEIIIISGELGCELFNYCFKGCNLYYRTVKKWDNKVLCSLKHFRFTDDDHRVESIRKILSALNDINP